MGIYIPASLSFGVVLRDEEVAKLPWSSDMDFLSWVRRSTGMTERTCPIDELLVYSEEEDEGVVVIAVRNSVSTAEWRHGGNDNPTTPKMSVDETDVQAAKDFCAYYDIPFENPGWLLSVCFLQ